MTYHVTLPRIGTPSAWRDAARKFLTNGVRPEDLTWGAADAPKGLFDIQPDRFTSGEIKVPRSFVSLANSVVWHCDPTRFAKLYAMLWRLQDTPKLMQDRSDPALARLRQMEKNVHRCQHKMKAFVRFREIRQADASRRSFAAWFEPTHHTVEPTANFFVRRFADMDWRIYTPDISAIFEAGKLTFVEDHPRPNLPPDASEALWVTYFQNIFNPARLKPKAMRSEMPKKYWKNMPETKAIPDMIAGAPARAQAMSEAMPTLPPARMLKAQQQQAEFLSSWTEKAKRLPHDLQGCTRCPLYKSTTQVVPGEGPKDADLMIVGEQPGDQEDLAGRPFVGPAGKIFDEVAADIGLDRADVYVTNAVKHFKHVPRGKRRIHQRPNASEVERCRVWLKDEIDQISPKILVALGMTAAAALTGNNFPLTDRRGTIEIGLEGLPVLISYHPSYLLRLSKGDVREAAWHAFRSDLEQAMRHVR